MITKADLVNTSTIPANGDLPEITIGLSKRTGAMVVIQGDNAIVIGEQLKPSYSEAVATVHGGQRAYIEALGVRKALLVDLTKAALVWARHFADPADVGKAAVVAARAALEELNQ